MPKYDMEMRMINATLFGNETQADHFLAFRYVGTSFDGQIELGKLAKELEGLEIALRILLESLARHKRLLVPLGDVVIVVEPFEKGSFAKKIKAVNKHLIKYKETYQTGLLLGNLMVGTLTLARTWSPNQLTEMSPELQAKIRDAVQIEILKNPDFRRGIAAIASPLYHIDDKLELKTPTDKSINIDRDDKVKLDLLAGKERSPVIRTQIEILKGRITRVDLDAYNNHLGLKVDGVGTTIKSTLINGAPQEEMIHYLGQWVSVTGTSTFQDNVRTKIDITEIELTEPPIQQPLIPISNP